MLNLTFFKPAQDALVECANYINFLPQGRTKVFHSVPLLSVLSFVSEQGEEGANRSLGLRSPTVR